jgi:serine/threonine-protein kinase RsbW
MASVLLRIPPEAAFVQLTRLVAAAMARKSLVDEPVLDDIRLAVGQACARAVSAHQDQLLADPVVVGFRDDDTIEVTVSDRVGLAEAEGDAAMEVLTEATSAIRPRDSRDLYELAVPGAAAIALIRGLAEDLTVTTGPTGSAVQMRWSPQLGGAPGGREPSS